MPRSNAGARTWIFSTISSSVPLSASWKLSGLASPSLSRMRTCSSPVLPFLSVYRFVSRFSYTISFEKWRGADGKAM